MFTAHKSLCPITGLEMLPSPVPSEDFRGIQYFIPSISDCLMVSMAENLLSNQDLRHQMTEQREKFARNLRMISKHRRQTIVSSANWWLFLK